VLQGRSRDTSGRAVWMAELSSGCVTAPAPAPVGIREMVKGLAAWFGKHIRLLGLRIVKCSHCDIHIWENDIAKTFLYTKYAVSLSPSLFFSFLPLACLASSLHCMKEMGRAFRYNGALLIETIYKMSKDCPNHGPSLNHINKASNPLHLFFFDHPFKSILSSKFLHFTSLAPTTPGKR